jgi:hypothetical protein
MPGPDVGSDPVTRPVSLGDVMRKPMEHKLFIFQDVYEAVSDRELTKAKIVAIASRTHGDNYGSLEIKLVRGALSSAPFEPRNPASTFFTHDDAKNYLLEKAQRSLSMIHLLEERDR